MTEPWQTIVQIALDLGKLLAALAQAAWHWGVLIAWVAWWLGGVNWRKLGPVLGQGAWVPVVLLSVLGAMVWSQIAPRPYDFLGVVTVPNFWWQLGGVGLLAGLTLFCGWLQGVFDWAPPDPLAAEAAASEHAPGNEHLLHLDPPQHH
ncbi:MAG TPA: hypothetical protein VNK04_08250 [Gemmataceae bacterium]|nr:hypothetical protein [Gemmataceae bacterium]